MKNSLNINPEFEKEKIIAWIKDVLQKQNFKNVIIGLSGGIDSAVALALITKTINSGNIFVVHSYYFKSQTNILLPFLKKLNIPQENIYNISIKKQVDEFKKTTRLTRSSKNYQIRLGNIMARVRMIILYDLARKNNALVCGTENKSEFYLGYFTRFGDEASDFEPIRHLYKTQVYQLAKHLNIPPKILRLKPTAGLWPGQTDEKEFGFSYKEADRVLNLYLDTKQPLSKIKSPNAKKIITRMQKNLFKHTSPYVFNACKNRT